MMMMIITMVVVVVVVVVRGDDADMYLTNTLTANICLIASCRLFKGNLCTAVYGWAKFLRFIQANESGLLHHWTSLIIVCSSSVVYNLTVFVVLLQYIATRSYYIVVYCNISW